MLPSVLTHRSPTDFGKARHRAPVLIDVATKPSPLLPKHDRLLAPASIARGACVILAGIGIGLFVNMPAPVDREAWLENAQRLWNEKNRSSIRSAIPATSRSFSPKFALANLQIRPPHRAERPSSSTVKGVHAAVTTPTPALRTTVTGWQPVVTNAAGTIKSGSGAASLKPNNPTSRYKLVVEIQRKLKKRGCYWGRISGYWGAGTKYAMQAFIDRVNATLPIKQPDYVLLTLLQANSDKTCGPCPAGQTATVGGSCMPQTTIADTQRKSGSGEQGGAEVFSWRRTGAPQPAAQPLLRPVGTTIVTTTPLPGRMAIGGPAQLPPPAAEYGNQPSSVAAIAIDESNDTGVSQPSITRAPSARRSRAIRRTRAARRKAKRPRRRHRGVQAARRRNLMLSLGGAN
ncbi:MAG: hypothetical protein ACR2OF_02530 [Hyphomicrobium sp.]